VFALDLMSTYEGEHTIFGLLGQANLTQNDVLPWSFFNECILLVSCLGAIFLPLVTSTVLMHVNRLVFTNFYWLPVQTFSKVAASAFPMAAISFLTPLIVNSISTYRIITFHCFAVFSSLLAHFSLNDLF
jgi:hypothetical protein